MNKKIKKHLGYYFSLLATLILGLALVFLAAPNLKMQIAIVLLIIFFYILWGTMHHLINHELTARIMIEYMLVGALGASIIFFMVMGGLI